MEGPHDERAQRANLQQRAKHSWVQHERIDVPARHDGAPVSGFLDKAKDMAEEVKDKIEDVVDKIEDKIPDSVKTKVEAVTDKIKDMIPGSDKGDKGDAGDKSPTEPGGTDTHPV